MCMTLCALAIGRLAYGLLVPAMRAELGFSVAQAGNLGTASSLGYLAMVIPAGLIATRRGPRLSILIGLLLLVLACLAMGFVGSYAGCLLAMVLMGFGTALLYTPLIALLVGWYPNRRGTVIGVANSGIGIGMLAIGLGIPRLIEAQGNGGFRLAWMLFAGFAALVLLAVGWRVRNPPVGGGATVKDSAQRKHDREQVWRNPGIRAIALVYGALGIGYIVQSVFMYSYALDSGVDPVRAGLMASTMGFLSIFAGSIWGSVSDYAGRAVTLMLCFAITCVITLLPVALPTDTGFAVHFAVSGLVLGGLFTVILAATSERVAPALVPVAVSLVTVVFAIGQLLGPAAAGWVIEATGRFSIAFIGSGLLMAIGVLFSYRLWRIEQAATRDA
jgi:MFS family permease